jgi:hypothetical protein
MNSGSVSKVDLVLSLIGKTKFNLELKRHLAPKTVGAIVRIIPFEGNAHMMGTNIAIMPISLSTGGEKLRTQFKKGDVAFLASNSSICFFIDDVSSSKSMTLIGKISSNLDLLKTIEPGDTFSVTQA